MISTKMSSNNEQDQEYDVFLSFHGVDSRDGFTSHLHCRLEEAEFNVFMDDKRLLCGEPIGEQLERAIKMSKISIPILSPNYATSKWCLKELAWIMECRDTIGQKVLPIFYKVEPRVVRNQTGSYEVKEHGKLVGQGRHFEEWGKALSDVARLKGLENRNEAALVKEITVEVRKFLPKKNPANSSVVGPGEPRVDPSINSQIEKIKSLSDDQKYIFLDIACFWESKLKYAPQYLWKDHFGQRWSLHIKALKSRSLIELKGYSYSMDKRLRDLGREIVQREYYDALPQKRTWLWKGKEGRVLLIKNQLELPNVEAISLERYEENYYEAKQFKKLPNLRFIRIEGADLEGNFMNILKNLRCLIWKDAPFKHTPQNLSLENLVVLDLSYSNIEDTWTWSTMQFASKLKDLSLNHCSKLIRGPNFSMFPNLERLDIEGCEQLESITLSSLLLLKDLDASKCKKLQDVHGLDQLKALKWLQISDCGAIKKLPNLSKLKFLGDLLAKNCISLQSLEGLEDLGSLGELNIFGCTAMIQLPNVSPKCRITKPNHLG